MTDYTPIDCGQYSEYELAILHRRRLRIAWRQPGGPTHIEICTPVDLVTRDHEEFLIAHGRDNRQLELRLDHISSTETL